MTRTIDPIFPQLQMALAEFPPVPTLPESLRGQDDEETENRILKLHDAAGEQLVMLAGAGIHFPQAIRVDNTLTSAVYSLMPELSLEQGYSVAIQVCFGCLYGAKVVRSTEMSYDLKTGRAAERPISDSERRDDLRGLNGVWENSNDIVRAAIGVGPIDKRLRHRQEAVLSGMEPALVRKLFPGYVRRFDPKLD